MLQQTFFEANDGTKSAYIGTDSSQDFIKLGSLSNHAVQISQNNAAAITIDTSKNVGIGNTTPSNAYSLADDLVVGSTSGAHGISIIAQDNTNGALNFADALAGDDGAASYAGYLAYNHASNFMHFGANSAERMRIDSSGQLIVGQTQAQVLLNLLLMLVRIMVNL